MKKKRNISKIILTTIMWLISLCMLYPFIWMVSASFTQESQVFNFPFKIIPDPITFDGYISAWIRNSLGIPMTVFFFNSIKVTAIGMAGCLLTCSMAAYGFSKIEFPGRDKIFLLLIGVMMIPFHVTILPKYLMFAKLGFVNHHIALWLEYFLGIPLGTFLMRQFFVSIPKEINESASMDGAGHVIIFSRLILPLCKPALATLAILSFMWLWNSYEYPLIFLRDPKLFTLPIAIKAIFDDKTYITYNGVMAAAVSAVTPIMIVFFALQKYFVKGIAMTGLK